MFEMSAEEIELLKNYAETPDWGMSVVTLDELREVELDEEGYEYV
jgi:hypothetical protein